MNTNYSISLNNVISNVLYWAKHNMQQFHISYTVLYSYRNWLEGSRKWITPIMLTGYKFTGKYDWLYFCSITSHAIVEIDLFVTARWPLDIHLSILESDIHILCAHRKCDAWLGHLPLAHILLLPVSTYLSWCTEFNI